MSEQPFRDIEPLVQENISQQNESLNDPLNQHPRSFAIGSGNNSVFMDARGVWMGNEDPEQAGLWMKPEGVLILKASALNRQTAIQYFDLNDKLAISIGLKYV